MSRLADGEVSLRVETPAQELSFDVGVPIVLDLIISSSGQASRNERPPSVIGKKQNKKTTQEERMK